MIEGPAKAGQPPFGQPARRHPSVHLTKSIGLPLLRRALADTRRSLDEPAHRYRFDHIPFRDFLRDSHIALVSVLDVAQRTTDLPKRLAAATALGMQ